MTSLAAAPSVSDVLVSFPQTARDVCVRPNKSSDPTTKPSWLKATK